MGVNATFNETTRLDWSAALPRVGGYELIEPLGNGGMGVVWRARDLCLEREVAIKMIWPHEDPSRRQEALSRFFLEAKATAAIKSPHVAKVLQLGVMDTGEAYIVMELLDGESLHSLLYRHGRLPVKRALRIARHVARGLKAAHRLNIVHRDLKPDNIMLIHDDEDDDEIAKIVDFGLAKRLAVADRLTAKDAVYGTVRYMAPEQIARTGVDQRTDVYALGCVLYRMLTGVDPFVAINVGDLALKIMNDAPAAPTRLASIPAEVEAIVLRCLEKQASERFASMEELDASLARLDSSIDQAPETHVVTSRFCWDVTGVTDHAVTAPIVETMPNLIEVEVPTTRIVKPRRRRRAPAVVLAACACVLFASMLAVAWTWEPVARSITAARAYVAVPARAYVAESLPLPPPFRAQAQTTPPAQPARDFVTTQKKTTKLLKGRSGRSVDGFIRVRTAAR